MEQEFSDTEKANHLESDLNHPLQNKQPVNGPIRQNYDFSVLESFIQILRKDLKDSDQNSFTLQNPNGTLIRNIILHWQNRSIKSCRCVLRLSIQECSIDRKAITELFQCFPSIMVTLNGDKIQNSNILQTIDEVFYEGTSKYLYIYDSKKQVEYQGQAENRIPHGKGYMTSKNQKDKFVYAGQFYQGNFHGRGELEDKINMVRYLGQFKDDLKHGAGEEIVVCKNQKGKSRKWHYQGNFLNGRRDGQGKQTSRLGVYQGSWKDGEKHGRGTFKFKNGNQYDGYWDQSKFHGKGTLIEKGKGLYKGNFEKGQFHGKGIYSYENGDKYDGNYSQNMRNGEGIYTWRDGDFYQGQWKDNSAHGQGSILNGLTFYQGEFKNGYRNGLGQLTNQDGNIIRGIWQNNELVQPES